LRSWVRMFGLASTISAEMWAKSITVQGSEDF
jgi:hypothetical protein